MCFSIDIRSSLILSIGQYNQPLKNASIRKKKNVEIIF